MIERITEKEALERTYDQVAGRNRKIVGIGGGRFYDATHASHAEVARFIHEWETIPVDQELPSFREGEANYIPGWPRRLLKPMFPRSK